MDARRVPQHDCMSLPLFVIVLSSYFSRHRIDHVSSCMDLLEPPWTTFGVTEMQVVLHLELFREQKFLIFVFCPSQRVGSLISLFQAEQACRWFYQF